MIKFSKKLKTTIKTATNIAVFAHIRPDCDALGSALSLKEGLEKLGKSVDFFSKDKLTLNQLAIFGESEIKSDDCDFDRYDMLISVDASSFDRLGAYAEGFASHTCTLILDHHRGNNLTGTFKYVFPEYSSCSEMVMELLNFLKIKIDKHMASLLYSGLSADTNSFINTNVNYNSFYVALKLISLGADVNKINELQYKNKTKIEVECKKYLWSNFKYCDDVSYIVVSNKALSEMGATKPDCDNFSNELLSIQGIHYSFSLIEEEQGKINLSMRSKDGYNVQKIASSLGGGGHLCASGATILNKTLQEALDIVLNEVRKSKS